MPEFLELATTTALVTYGVQTMLARLPPQALR
jgi:hypothetical protein